MIWIRSDHIIHTSLSGVKVQDSIMADPTTAGVLEYPCFRSQDSPIPKPLTWQPSYEHLQSCIYCAYANLHIRKGGPTQTMKIRSFLSPPHFFSPIISLCQGIWQHYTLRTESVLTAFMVKAPKCATVNKIN